ncbi:hypothetical protein HJC23_001826 [Cyclotella cryptica]|uniref:Uncharacterized protein n=1 Tax=Cyclotella cryptica TaxID=29204 RepID=A0ABD3PI99_9STRA|eukprot:CCRYP_014528-RB/>CCRYP_014528-RB protein AED:0.00 eAED:0.00 QI:357/-1/1/1/-1/1/1/190/554
MPSTIRRSIFNQHGSNGTNSTVSRASTRRMARVSISAVTKSFVGVLVLTRPTASAFMSPNTVGRVAPSMPFGRSKLPTRSRGRLRMAVPSESRGLYASIASDQSVSPSSAIQDGEPSEVIMASAALPNQTAPYFVASTHEETGASTLSSLAEPIRSFGDADEQHTQRTGMASDVAEVTHLPAHDEKDLQNIMYPSIAISYDSEGMVQADVSPLIGDNYSPSLVVPAQESDDYPAFIRFLFQKDVNGQTFASKLFNFALLAISFCFVFSSVFNIDKGMTRGWTPGEIGMRIPLDTWASYENSLSEKPVATKTIINVVIYLLGDWLSQTLFQRKNVLDFDAARTIKNGFVGMCFGPAVHEYYEFSDWILPVDGATFGITNRAFKILMDQTIYLSVKCSIYIVAIGVLNGETVENSAENVKNRLKPIMFTAWRFWPLVHCVTYGLIPARHRILWVNSVDLVWNAILASKARDDGSSEEKSTQAEEKSEDGIEAGDSNEASNLSSIMRRVAFEMDGLITNSTLTSTSDNNASKNEQHASMDDERSKRHLVGTAVSSDD